MALHHLSKSGKLSSSPAETPPRTAAAKRWLSLAGSEHTSHSKTLSMLPRNLAYSSNSSPRSSGLPRNRSS